MQIHPINLFQVYKQNFKPMTVPVFQNRLNCDVVSFTGAKSSAYATNYDAYCAKYFSNLPGYSGEFSSPKNFDEKAEAKYDALVKEIFPKPNELGKNYQCIYEYWDKPITDSRKQVLAEWINFLKKPEFGYRLGYDFGENSAETSGIFEIIKNNPSLKLIILETVISNINTCDKRIPPPLNPYAVAKTVQALGELDRKDVGKFSFAKTYNSELLNLIINRAKKSAQYSYKSRTGMIEGFPYSDENLSGMWIKIPAKRHNKRNLTNNINAVEIISHENWCTKNALYKAKACLIDGDFYVFLEKQEDGEYKPTIGMALSKNIVMQIQDPRNNDQFGAEYLPVIDFILKEKKLELDYWKRDDGIPAGRQYEITKALNSEINGKTLATAIKEKDAETIFQYAGIDYKKDEETGLLILSKYKPKIKIKKHLPPIYFYELGIDEYAILSKVSKIEGRAEFQNSRLDSLPDSITAIRGYIIARPRQFYRGNCKERFKDQWIETKHTSLKDYYIY